MRNICATVHSKVTWDSPRLKMLLLGARPACKATMNENQKNLSRTKTEFSCFFCWISQKGDLGYGNANKSATQVCKSIKTYIFWIRAILYIVMV